MSEPRCCGSCGRWGNRAYRWEAEREWWVCTNDRACRLRIRRVATPGHIGHEPDSPECWDKCGDPTSGAMSGMDPDCTCGGVAACIACQDKDAVALAHEVEATPNTPDGTMYICRVCGYWGLSMPAVPCTTRAGR